MWPIEACASAPPCPPPSSCFSLSFLLSLPFLYLLSIVLIIPFIYSILRFAYARYQLPRGTNLRHWSRAIIAHRGYRSTAQSGAKKIVNSTTPILTAKVNDDDDTASVLSPSPSPTSSSLGPRRVMTPSFRLSLDGFNIPENSLLAFIFAHESGAHGVEVDVGLTSDGEILVMHDSTIDRTMDGTGEYCKMTLAAIQSYRYKKVTDVEYVIRDPCNRALDTSRPPTLEQVVMFCRERSMRLMIETKEYTNHNLLRSKIAALYDKHDMYAWSFVASFNPMHMYAYRKFYPKIPICLLYCRSCLEWYHADNAPEMRLPRAINFAFVRSALDWALFTYSPTILADFLGVSIIGPHNVLVSPLLTASAEERGIVVDVWVCNSDVEKLRLLELGCIVTTDRLFAREDVNPFDALDNEETKARRRAGMRSKMSAANAHETMVLDAPRALKSAAISPMASPLASTGGGMKRSPILAPSASPPNAAPVAPLVDIADEVATIATPIMVPSSSSAFTSLNASAHVAAPVVAAPVVVAAAVVTPAAPVVAAVAPVALTVAPVVPIVSHVDAPLVVDSPPHSATVESDSDCVLVSSSSSSSSSSSMSSRDLSPTSADADVDADAPVVASPLSASVLVVAEDDAPEDEEEEVILTPRQKKTTPRKRASMRAE